MALSPEALAKIQAEKKKNQMAKFQTIYAPELIVTGKHNGPKVS